MTAVKICGLKNAGDLAAAQNAGSEFVGFVFREGSTRYISPEDAAPLVRQASIKTVGLFVDPDDDTLRRILDIAPVDMIQLHGNESPMRVALIKSYFQKPVMKAIRVAEKDDLARVQEYEEMADWLLFDAKVPGLSGGTGRAFDWTLLAGFRSTRPWMLAGGLNIGNVRTALATLNPAAVDVSSGVESAPGVKDAGKIVDFVNSVRHAKQL